MTTKGPVPFRLTHRVQLELEREEGLTVKELASRLQVTRHFMAGFLAAMEEHGLVRHRVVGPARIYFTGSPSPAKDR